MVKFKKQQNNMDNIFSKVKQIRPPNKLNYEKNQKYLEQQGNLQKKIFRIKRAKKFNSPIIHSRNSSASVKKYIDLSNLKVNTTYIIP